MISASVSGTSNHYILFQLIFMLLFRILKLRAGPPVLASPSILSLRPVITLSPFSSLRFILIDFLFDSAKRGDEVVVFERVSKVAFEVLKYWTKSPENTN